MIHAIEFHSFCNAKQRCTNTKHPRYNDWGGRGIQFKFKNKRYFYGESFGDALACKLLFMETLT